MVGGLEGCLCPSLYPREFRDDVVRVARNRDEGVTLEQIATDFGVHPMTLSKWMRQADIDAGVKPGVSTSESAELREARRGSSCWSRRTRSCAGPRRICRRRTCREKALPARERARRRRHPRRGDVPGTEDCSSALLPVAARPVTDADLTEAYRANALFDAHVTTRSSATGSWPTRPVCRAADGRAHRVADLLRYRLVESFSARTPRQERQGGTAGARRPRRRDFTAEAPNRLWLADITEHRTGEGKLYLCAIKDVSSNRIVGYSIDSRMKSRLAVNALHNAVARRGDIAGCVLHTDRGSQFRSRKFVHALNQHHMIGSMGRVGAAGDNAAMESFFGLLQNNVLDRRNWSSRQQLRTAIVTWIERTYHRRRRQRSLSQLTPVEYETSMTPPASQAA